MQDETGEAANEAQKYLTFYELDLGLNHVVRKWSDPVDNGANLLIPVPGGDSEGPGGVLVCAENFIIFKNEGHADVRAVIPKRSSLSEERGVLIVSYAMHKQKSLFYFFVQVMVPAIPLTWKISFHTMCSILSQGSPSISMVLQKTFSPECEEKEIMFYEFSRRRERFVS